ncbi:MAG: hypothetical protein RIF32_10340, partial [Leptospirales bacterium]
MLAAPLLAFELNFEPAPGVQKFEIQWLSESSQPDEPGAGPTEYFEAPPFQTSDVPDGTRYYRVRAIAQGDVAGPWSKSYAINSTPARKKEAVAEPESGPVFKTVQRSDGTKERYLIGSQIRLAAQDDFSGVQRTEYRLNRGAVRKYSNSISIPGDGSYILEFRSTDGAGNQEPWQAIRFQVDRTPPVTKLRFADRLVQNKGNVYTAPANSIQLTGHDVGSGILITKYRLY